MPDDFRFDVFLSHSSKDKLVVRDIAERLKKDGVKVWFAEWITGLDAPVAPVGQGLGSEVEWERIEEGLEHSRALVLCMSANAFGSDWAQLETGTFRFRDPMNKQRRFIPLRLDDSPVEKSLLRIRYVDWRLSYNAKSYSELVGACLSVANPPGGEAIEHSFDVLSASKSLKAAAEVRAYSFSTDGKRVLSAHADGCVRLWNYDTGQRLRVFEGHHGIVCSVAFSPNEDRFLSGAYDSSMRVWDIASGKCLQTFGHQGSVSAVSWTSDQNLVLSGDSSGKIRLWSLKREELVLEYYGHSFQVSVIRWGKSERYFYSAAMDGTVRQWSLDHNKCVRLFSGHSKGVNGLSESDSRELVISGSKDHTLRLWDVGSSSCLRIFEGHTDIVLDVSLRGDSRFAVSCSCDSTIRLWDVETGKCLSILQVSKNSTRHVAWLPDRGECIQLGDDHGNLTTWDLSEFVSAKRTNTTEGGGKAALPQVQYTNAKVLLVGESGAGKTGLSKRLALDDWQPSDSTVGAWATQWKLPVSGGKGVEREIWLWDFGGQADQRLIHQLYMDETALAVLVFDGQKEDLFQVLGQWDRDLMRASRKEFAKLLVAGRVDAGGLRASRSEVEKFAAERKFRGFLETSAKTGLHCEELKKAILDAIEWDNLPCRTTEMLFKQLKEEIVRLKDEGRVLMRFNELRETIHLRLSGEMEHFSDEELRAVLTLLAGPGVVWELAFGSWVLMQPERINAYAQAVIRTLQADEHQRGCLSEEKVLKGELIYDSSMDRLQGDEERFVLLAMHQTLVERGLCLRQPTVRGNLLVFPSYYRRERPDLVGHPAVLVNYRFTGFLDEIYASLVVRLHHIDTFKQDQLWRGAADFTTNTGRQLGVKLTRHTSGLGELEVYFEPAVALEEKIIFSKYVHEHLLNHAQDVERLRHYVCPHCGTHVGNREVAMKRLEVWLQRRPATRAESWLRKAGKAMKNPPNIICVNCEERVPLWDEMEQCFASSEIQQRVYDMRQESQLELDNESKERALVGEVISTVALAAQICREFNVSDHGIDMEIEFKDDQHQATHRKIYLQLKSGDSYTRKNKKTGSEIFTIKDQRHVRYWIQSQFPVLLVIRKSDGEVRWMEVRD